MTVYDFILHCEAHVQLVIHQVICGQDFIKRGYWFQDCILDYSTRHVRKFEIEEKVFCDGSKIIRWHMWI